MPLLFITIIFCLFLLAIILGRLFRWLIKSTIYQKLHVQLLNLRRKYPIVYLLVGLSFSAFMMTLFMELTEETFISHDIDSIDSLIIEYVRYFANPNIDTIMIYITSSGSAQFYGFSFIVILLILSFYRRWREAFALSICLGGASILNYLLKNLYERSRPDLLRVVEASGYSFPSGHAMVSLCYYGMIVYLVRREILSRRARFTLLSLFSILIIAIGISRIYLGVHYPSDILAGYTAGGSWLVFCISLLKWWEKRRV